SSAFPPPSPPRVSCASSGCCRGCGHRSRCTSVPRARHRTEARPPARAATASAGGPHTLGCVSTTPHPGSEHLIILPDREVADELAEELRDEGFEQVRVVREAARNQEHGEDDRDVEW